MSTYSDSYKVGTRINNMVISNIKKSLGDKRHDKYTMRCDCGAGYIWLRKQVRDKRYRDARFEKTIYHCAACTPTKVNFINKKEKPREKPLTHEIDRNKINGWDYRNGLKFLRMKL